MKMSISTAIEERTDGEDDTSQESQSKNGDSDIENDNDNANEIENDLDNDANTENENSTEHNNDNDEDTSEHHNNDDKGESENEVENDGNDTENENDIENDTENDPIENENDDKESENENSENAHDNENNSQKRNGVSPEIHEITSDDDEDDCVMTNEDDESSISSANEVSQNSNNKNSNNMIENHKTIENGDDDEESDIEEVSAEDPLNEATPKAKPIVINDAKKLVDVANNSKSNDQNKEPTVVIIDTNSIISKSPNINKNSTTKKSSAQSLCESIAARGTTITPVSVKSNPPSNTANNAASNTNASTTPQAPILPSLTDDMFVVEAPSFIVPYVYEKPSMKPFREFVDALGKELDEIRLKEEKEKLEKEKEEKERKEKEKQEKIARGETVEDSDEESKKEEAKAKRAEKREKRRKKEDDDVSWDGESTSSSDEAISDEDVAVLNANKAKDEIKGIGLSSKGKSDSYFDCSLGQFFINIGVNLVQEYVQSDLLKQQNRKLYKEKKSGRSTKATEAAIASLTQNLEFSKKTNLPYSLDIKKCEFCSFKTESLLTMAHHLEAPHMKNNIYKCNKCPYEIRSPHDILFHMEAEHNVRGRLERAPAYQQCANCTFEDNSKSKLARHLIACAKKFKPHLNLEPPIEWEPPAKIPKLSRPRNNVVGAYPQNFNRGTVGNNMGRPMNSNMIGGAVGIGNRPRGRPPLPPITPRAAPVPGVPLMRGGLMIMHNSQQNLGSNYPMMNNQTSTTPKISITPLPRTPQAQQSMMNPGNKGTFVICEICDGYIKDLEQLRNHMQWIHKVKIHPKMIYNRPPLNCQKCQFRFFTDQGLERHLLGSHGLVTSSMQEAANKGKDAGRCPVCGRVYQWKLLNHVARDHNMTLKPAHLSYKCTVCTATFGMYKQFENHVYSAHSVVAKRVMDKGKPSTPTAAAKAGASDGDAMMKPIKINDEITIIPQPNKGATSSKEK